MALILLDLPNTYRSANPREDVGNFEHLQYWKLKKELVEHNTTVEQFWLQSVMLSICGGGIYHKTRAEHQSNQIQLSFKTTTYHD